MSYEEKKDKPFIAEFIEPKPVREISIVTHKHFAKEKLIEVLRDSILKSVPKHFKKNTNFKTIEWR